MSVPMTLSDLERRNVMVADLLITLVRFDTERPNSAHGNTCGTFVFLPVIRAPIPKERGPSAPQFLEFPLLMHTPVNVERLNSAW